MIISTVLVILGFIVLIKGADWLVTGASSLAKKHNISDLAIGLTIVAFGTSAPELVVNSIASMENHSDIIFGNVIGSNNFNLFFILGIVGLIYPITVHSNTVWKEIPISFFAIIAMFVLSNRFILQADNVLTRIDGMILLGMFALFLYYVYRQMKIDQTIAQQVTIAEVSSWKIWALILSGLAGLILGSRLVVNSSIEIATFLGVSEKIIGLTIIAAGTSLPELVTSAVAAIKKNSDIAIGNIVGSNIFNLLFILSVSSLINPVSYNPAFNMDVYLLAGGTLFLFLVMFTGKKHTLGRLEAALLLGTFLIYMGYLVAQEI
jgi:cation:H+ antiporter